MKKTFFLILALLTLNSYSQTINNLDEKYGYKDLRFGTLKSALKDKIYSSTPNGHCLVIGDNYRKVRNVTIDHVYMKFIDDKLFAIILTISGEANVDNLLNIYTETYGNATSADKVETVFTWEGKSVILSYDIDLDEAGYKATVFISAKDLLNKNYQAEIQKNKDDL